MDLNFFVFLAYVPQKSPSPLLDDGIGAVAAALEGVGFGSKKSRFRRIITPPPQKKKSVHLFT